MSDWIIRPFRKEDEEIWDRFVQEGSINGTFLQEWRFLNYHPHARFYDCSLMIFYKEQLSAVIPACETEDEGKKTFFSHKGSTYGGPVLSKKIYNASEIMELINELECFLRGQGFEKCVLKPTMSLLCSEGMDLLEYCLCSQGYHEYKELELYIDYEKFHKDVMPNLSHMKQRIVKKCIKEGIQVKELVSNAEIDDFHTMLSQNLEKFGTKPIHTTEELLNLKNQRLPEEIAFFGAYLNEKLVAGTMVFHFFRSRCAHTQYLAADLTFNQLSPLSYIYYDMARRYQDLGYRYLSWGITSEHLGTQLNMGLTRNKESFGSVYMINHIYAKNL